MEAIFLDSLFRPSKIVDAFTSFIWIDRYCGAGNFELRLPMSSSALAGIKIGDYVSITQSKYHMIVEGINISITSEDAYATITGRSLETILNRRFIYSDAILSGNLQDGILRLLNTEIIDPNNEDRKIVQFYFIESDDPAVQELEIDYQVTVGDNLYDVIYAICNSKHLGFRLIPGDTDGTMGFLLYKGVDHSYRQDKNSLVVFSPNFENLKSSEMDMDVSSLRNYMLVRSDYTETVQVPVDVDIETGEVKYESVTVDRRIEAEVGADLSGLDRYEVFKRSNLRPDDIDRSSFGSPSDYVNKNDFCKYEATHFDSDAYYKEYQAFQDKANSLYQPAVKEHTETRLEWMKPGDEGYIPEIGGSVGQAHAVTVVVPGTTPEEFQKNNALYFNYVENNKPDKENYKTYEWVMYDAAGYAEALMQAAARIEAEIEAARAKKREKCQAIMQTEAEAEMANMLGVSTFEGDLDPRFQEFFGKDYYLGDEVQIINEYGYQAVTRITEIMYSEEEGVGYLQSPTFESDDKAEFE